MMKQNNRNSWLQRALPTISFLVFFGTWEAIVRLRGIPPIYLPAPSMIAEALWVLVADGTMPLNLAYTLVRIFEGFAAAALGGIAIGIYMGMSPTFARILDPWIAALYPLPKISLIPLLIIWLGTGDVYKIAISAISAIFPVIISTYAGIRQVDPDLIKAAVDLGANQRQTQLKVVLPAALPSIFSGLQLGMGIAIILVVAAEMIGGSGQGGMGYLLINFGQLLETEKVFACLIVLAFIGAVIIKSQEWLDHRIAPWASKRGSGGNH
jgi:ABC-type nitrate/sulfonate/bicarbonate transport system permease component